MDIPMTSFTMQDTFDKVADIIATTLSVDKKSVMPAATLQDLGADSLDLVEIVMKIEEEFGIEINDEVIEKLENVQDLINYVHELRTK